MWPCWMRKTDQHPTDYEHTWPFFFFTSQLTRPFLSEPRTGKMRKHRLLLRLGLNLLSENPPPDII